MSLPNSPTALILDLCGTTILENTTDNFLDHWLPLEGMRRMTRRIIGGKRPTCALSLYGLSRQYLYEEAARYMRDRLERLGNPIVMDAIALARSSKIPIYLATATLDPIAHAARDQLGLDGVVSTKLRYRGDFCMGILARDLIGRKLPQLRQIVPNEMLAGAVLYTDNEDDTDLIRATAHTYFLGNLPTHFKGAGVEGKVTVLVQGDVRGTHVVG